MAESCLQRDLGRVNNSASAVLILSVEKKIRFGDLVSEHEPA
jgi:hypothetical protein